MIKVIKGQLKSGPRSLFKKSKKELFLEKPFRGKKLSLLTHKSLAVAYHFIKGHGLREQTMSSIFRIFLCQLQKRDKTLWSRTFLFYHVRTMNLCAYEKGNKRAVKSWHEVAYEKSQTETILWPTIFAGKKLSLPCLKTDAFLAVKDGSFQARKTEENLLHCCWLLKMLSGIQKCSDSFFLFLIYKYNNSGFSITVK